MSWGLARDAIMARQRMAEVVREDKSKETTMNLTDDMKRLGWYRWPDHFDKVFDTEDAARAGKEQVESTFAAHGRHLRNVDVYKRPAVDGWRVEAYWVDGDE